MMKMICMHVWSILRFIVQFSHLYHLYLFLLWALEYEFKMIGILKGIGDAIWRLIGRQHRCKRILKLSSSRCSECIGGCIRIKIDASLAAEDAPKHVACAMTIWLPCQRYFVAIFLAIRRRVIQGMTSAFTSGSCYGVSQHCYVFASFVFILFFTFFPQLLLLAMFLNSLRNWLIVVWQITRKRSVSSIYVLYMCTSSVSIVSMSHFKAYVPFHRYLSK